MHEMIIELYKCLGNEIDSAKHYTEMVDKFKRSNNTDIASLIEKMASQKKEQINNITKIIREYIKVSYSNNRELQELVNVLNDIMVKTFI